MRKALQIIRHARPGEAFELADVEDALG